MNKLISIIILTFNSKKYIEDCLQSVLEQTYENIEIVVVDNNSKDRSVEIVRKILREYKRGQSAFANLPAGKAGATADRVILNNKNFGYAEGNNVGIRESRGEYIILLNVDTILDKDFVQEIAGSFEKDSKIGSVQGKVYQLNNNHPPVSEARKTKIIDTFGFTVFKSGRIIDAGQGTEDIDQYSSTGSGLRKVFGVNGVAPAYRRIALNDIKLKDEYLDKDFFCYCEDVDLAWRLNWRGWLVVFNPNAVVWHDRTSSKSVGKGWKEFRKTRKSQSLWMRKISWRNTWLVFIKNLPFKSFLNPQFLKRQIKFGLYLLFFEPRVLLAKFEIIKLFPRMLKKRKLIMKNKKVNYVRLD
ncbi:glycosyltransferase [Patescibacteria group bacterium]|nr:glycosyltransferase [Patescibacteria group bacterium]MBU4458756.1 glycosyltransferase [Patescibacteria group bacterium]MCG2696057.1 glycosyltransferase [Candidatus Portnoybacteria bacterium]